MTQFFSISKLTMRVLFMNIKKFCKIKITYFVSIPTIRKTKACILQSRKQLYIHKCPSVSQLVSQSVTKTPQPLRINHSTLPPSSFIILYHASSSFINLPHPSTFFNILHFATFKLFSLFCLNQGGVGRSKVARCHKICNFFYF